MLDFLGLFILLAGFVIGLGAVTVIDLHGFLGRNSKYWTEATTRTHKVTKPLIWFGIFMVIAGGTIFFRDEKMSGVSLFHFSSCLILILNGLFLTFYVSPYLLKKEKEGRASELLSKNLQFYITISFLISFVFWWSMLFSLVYYITI
jgi:hypothetical protein